MNKNDPAKLIDPSGRISARAAACRAVSEALMRRGFISQSLSEMQKEGLRGRDAALASEIALGALRRLLTIEAVLSRVATYQPRHVSPRLRSVLATAAYQLIWLDRVPDFAAVDEAVNLAKRFAGHGESRMTNAVLRRLANAVETRRTPWVPLHPQQVRVNWDQACTFSIPVLPDPQDSGESAYWAASIGERPRRHQQLVEFFGEEAARDIGWASQAAPPIVLIPNTLRLDIAAAGNRLRAAFGEDVAVDANGRGFISGQGPLANSPLLLTGDFYVQDTTAQACADAAPLALGQRILDLCAAPGGKSIALALARGDQGEIIACDTSAARLARLMQNVERLKLHSIHATQLPHPDAPLAPLGEFDLALVDAPCSNSGVLVCRSEARFALHDDKIASLTELQRALLQRAAAVVRPGGALVYSTCSIEPVENAEQVRACMASDPGWQLESETLHLPRWTGNLTDWRDGGYVAVLRRGPATA